MQNTALLKFFEYKKNKPESSVMSASQVEAILTKNKEAIKLKIESKHIHVKIEPKIEDLKPEINDDNEPLFPPEIAKSEPTEECKNTIALELFSRDDLLIKTSLFASGTLREAIHNAAGIYCKESNG